MTSQLFAPVQIGKRTLTNRITVAPMCQYSAVDGSMSDWHLMHLGSLAISGASMLVMEATGVTPAGRITPYCPGLYSDANEAAMKRVTEYLRSISPIVLGVQLAHAGRKASSHRPWQGHGPLQANGGQAAACERWPEPQAMSKSDMQQLTQAFVHAAQRAARIGLDFIELHSTHGYLLSEFLSPLSNKRTDEYGGSLENRMRFPLEVFRAIRAAFPADRFVGAKISGTDFVDGGFSPDEAVAYARALKAEGCAYVTVSGGGVVLDAKIPVGPGYQVPFAGVSCGINRRRRHDHRSARHRRQRSGFHFTGAGDAVQSALAAACGRQSRRRTALCAAVRTRGAQGLATGKDAGHNQLKEGIGHALWHRECSCCSDPRARWPVGAGAARNKIPDASCAHDRAGAARRHDGFAGSSRRRTSGRSAGPAGRGG
jgi:2,4-dienoyl-CoA reductase-like NADH-dependent reductase (Old Yellow Enzyme family)